MKKLSTFSLLFLALAGCQRDPHLPPLSQTPSVAPQEVIPQEIVPMYVLQTEGVMDFEEGKTSEYFVNVRVPDGMTPRVTVSDLPTGAIYDQKSSKIIWTPSYTSADDPARPASAIRTYPISLRLQAVEAPASILSRKATLVVRNVPQAFRIKLNSLNMQVIEGQILRERITIDSADFPSGPMQIVATGLPVGAHIDPTSYQANSFDVIYAPNLTDVTAQNVFDYSTRSYKKDSTFTVTAINPRGESVTTPAITLTTYDRRMPPTVVAPSSIKQGRTVNFQVTGEDLNLEGQPSITMTRKPSTGTVTVSEDSADFHHNYLVTWTDFPDSMDGKTEQFQFHVCSLGNSYAQQCTDKTVNVTIAIGANPQ
ncbi:MAG: hypothetical protein JST16_18875 [Bdellovibrionales bacterium]|nr:hypothetical protein [Bdellovibrionales bacterium]